jgi:uncharacterized membrane protein YcaP (DUF421 family)
MASKAAGGGLMFEMTVPAWELIARALMVYVVLMVMVRISGKRTLGQFTPFDLLVVMLLSEGVSNALSGGEESLTGGIVTAATLVSLNVSLALASAYSVRAERLTEGTPVLVGRDGQIFHAVLKRERVGIGELERALRQNDCELKDMQCLFVEIDGSFSILKKR